MGKLVISRHGESEWNLLGKWTGWTDVGLTEKGYADTVHLGKLLQDIDFDVCIIDESGQIQRPPQHQSQKCTHQNQRE